MQRFALLSKLVDDLHRVGLMGDHELVQAAVFCRNP
jgi:hypothetical protein